METDQKASFWWLKKPQEGDTNKPLVIPKLDLKGVNRPEKDPEVDVGSILEEIDRVAAQSPLGPYEKKIGERSINDIIKEAEKVYMESSKSFEQLSQRSKTSQNISDLLSSYSKLSTPTPKSISPLPVDSESKSDDLDSASSSDEASEYSEDFVQESKNAQGVESEELYQQLDQILSSAPQPLVSPKDLPNTSSASQPAPSPKKSPQESPFMSPCSTPEKVANSPSKAGFEERNWLERERELQSDVEIRDKMIKTLEEENCVLKKSLEAYKVELETTRALIENLKRELASKTASTPELSLELEKVLEQLKDSKEINTSLQLQLDAVNKTHQLLKSSYEDLLASNKSLERNVIELESALSKYKNELVCVQETKSKLVENEISLNKLLEIEKLQCKSLKLQNEKDSKCIQDLNRQIKEMERIIARKHPDSVSALIVAAKEDATDSKKLLEDRIKVLERDLATRDAQSSKVFLEIQEKFQQLKAKYESHIADLELHVSDLKNQLKTRTASDTYDVYTQTSDVTVPQKETTSAASQTDADVKKIRPKKSGLDKEDAHLLATIRGLQTDLSNKEKVIAKLQKDLEETRKTNRRLQKEREGSFRNLSNQSFPDKMDVAWQQGSLKQQLARLEDDFQALKKKRLDDLTALQEAHEREISNYMATVAPLREQLELQQVSVGALQGQLCKTKEELAVVTAERDHLNDRLAGVSLGGAGDGLEVEGLLKKIAFLERRYEEREHRLRAIVQSLAQKNVTNRSCEQCAERQQQLIGYKLELDQLLATVRALK